jgi:putative SOS response-associated peptidase YedK
VIRATEDLLPDLLDAFDPLPDDLNVAPTQDVALVRERERAVPAAYWGGTCPVERKTSKSSDPSRWTRASRPCRRRRCHGNRLRRHERSSRRPAIMSGSSETGTQPHFIHQPDAALAMAGIFSAWPDPAKDSDGPDKCRLSTAIITRDAHVAPGAVHDRMPAFLTPDAYDDWLGEHLPASDPLKLLDRESLQVAHVRAHYEVS